MTNRRLEGHFGRRCYRFMPVQNGMGAPGLDYHCCIDGLAVFIETKVPGKTLTDRQKVTRDKVLQAGGLFFEIHDTAEIDTMIAKIEFALKCTAYVTIRPKAEAVVRQEREPVHSPSGWPGSDQ